MTVRKVKYDSTSYLIKIPFVTKHN
ncbi:uncharacterized protein METZ01_LOCUS61854 [marine metagenome]|uniref:Uncharacterized protein n=1 Tax=marine metagenome TaxID=408172 RepID=A0A381SYA3_9ZZZZ